MAAKKREFSSLFCDGKVFLFVVYFFLLQKFVFPGQQQRETNSGEISFFSLSLPHKQRNTHTHIIIIVCALFCFSSHRAKNGILRVRIDISGSLSGFEHGDEEAGTKSIDECIDESGDSVVVDFDD